MNTRRGQLGLCYGTSNMCGIAGVLERTGSRPAEAVMRAMALTLTHRGPDGGGLSLLGQCALAHRRLAIIDLSAEAAQPMQSAEDPRVTVVFNGEIYNFGGVRAELEALGHQFHTKSDTEVILAGWLEWGTGAFARLDGMFAIAIWDARDGTLTLARDRTGKKPLFVYEDSNRLIFASEIKAILAMPGVDTRPNPEAIPQFLSHGYVPSPATFYSRIRRVAPASWEQHTVARSGPPSSFWDFPLGQERQDLDLGELESECRETFFQAVRNRLVSDVPLGAFLSGGIDSTLVVGVMARFSSHPVRTFSIGFEGQPAWDETAFARVVAEHFGTAHTEFKMRPESFNLLEKLAWHYDEPFGDSSCIPTFMVSKLTRERVTVALTGDGGDEAFAGYPRFRAAVAGERIPPLFRSAGRIVAPLIPPLGHHHGVWERSRRMANALTKELDERLRSWMTFFTVSELRGLLIPEFARFADEAILGNAYRKHIAHARDRGSDPLNQVLYANARTYLLDDLNVKMDRASMAVGLEARAPFLDTKLLEFAFRLPAHFKLRGGTTKWLLKRALRDFIPDKVIHRPKMGFGVPLGAWFRKERQDELTKPPSPALSAILRPGAWASLLNQHVTGKRDLGVHIFLLRMLDIWLTRQGA